MVQDEDVVALECPDPAVLAFRVRLLNRTAERVGNVPSAPRPRPVLAPPHHASSAAQAAKVRTSSTPHSVWSASLCSGCACSDRRARLCRAFGTCTPCVSVHGACC